MGGAVHLRLPALSPDDRYLTATNSDSDGAGLTSVTVLRATTGDRRPATRSRPDNGFIGLQAWENDGHLLFVRDSYGSGAWDIVPADFQGNVERVAAAVTASEDEPPHSLGGNRCGPSYFHTRDASTSATSCWRFAAGTSRSS